MTFGTLNCFEKRYDAMVPVKKIRLHLLVQLMVMIFIRQIHMFNSNGKKMVELPYVPVQDIPTKTTLRFVFKFGI